MSNILLSTSNFPIQPALLSAAIPIVADFCCYHVFKMAISPQSAYRAASLGGVLAFIAFCPRSEKTLLGTSLIYLSYKVAHYFLRREGTATSNSSSGPTLTFTKPASASSTSATSNSPAQSTTTAAAKSTTPPTPKPPASQSPTAEESSDSDKPAAPPSISAAPKQSPAAKPAEPPISRTPASQNLAALVSSAPKSATSSSAPVAAQSPAPQEPLREIPPVREVGKRFDALVGKVTLIFDGPINVDANCPPHVTMQEIEKKEGFKKDQLDQKMRERWNSKELAEESVEIVKSAAAQLAVLYYELITATKNITDKDEKHQAMARLLMNDERFSKRFYPSNTKTVLHIYRFVRGLRYILDCPSLVHNQCKDKKLRFSTKLKDADIQPFSELGTPQCACREAYNKVIEIFAPLKPYLSDEIQAWLVKDEMGQPFEIIPRKGSNNASAEKK